MISLRFVLIDPRNIEALASCVTSITTQSKARPRLMNRRNYLRAKAKRAREKKKSGEETETKDMVL